MSEDMIDKMDDLIQSGIEKRDIIVQFLMERGWNTNDRIPYGAVVVLIGSFFNER